MMGQFGPDVHLFVGPLGKIGRQHSLHTCAVVEFKASNKGGLAFTT